MAFIIECYLNVAEKKGRAEGENLKIQCYQDKSSYRYIVRNMFTASEVAIALFRHLQRFIEARQIVLDVYWLPLSLNAHADRLCRTWDTGEIQISRSALLQCLLSQSVRVAFSYHIMHWNLPNQSERRHSRL